VSVFLAAPPSNCRLSNTGEGCEIFENKGGRAHWRVSISAARMRANNSQCNRLTRSRPHGVRCEHFYPARRFARKPMLGASDTRRISRHASIHRFRHVHIEGDEVGLLLRTASTLLRGLGLDDHVSMAVNSVERHSRADLRWFIVGNQNRRDHRIVDRSVPRGKTGREKRRRNL